MILCGFLCGGCQHASAPKDPLILFPPQIDRNDGKVTVNGVDPNKGLQTHTWYWGDGHSEVGGFPRTHVYDDTERDYVLTVAASYPHGQTLTKAAPISFTKK